MLYVVPGTAQPHFFIFRFFALRVPLFGLFCCSFDVHTNLAVNLFTAPINMQNTCNQV